MKVIIPAAGRGTRLRPLTDFSPKCLADINGQPLLFYLLSDLKRLRVEEVVIVTGHLSHMIEDFACGKGEFPKVSCIYNERYDSTNSIVSLSLTQHLWNEDFCIIDSDLLVRQPLLEKLINGKDTCLVIDSSKPHDAIDMKAKVENGRFLHMDKTMLRKDTFGEFFGLSRWTASSAAVLGCVIQRYLLRNETKVWYEWPIREMAKDYFLPVVTCSSDMWFEIDDMSDYAKAERFYG